MVVETTREPSAALPFGARLVRTGHKAYVVPGPTAGGMSQIVPLFPGVPGGPELLVILLIVVVLFGANKLPKLARSIGEAEGEFKKGRQEIQGELDSMQEAASVDSQVDRPNENDYGTRGGADSGTATAGADSGTESTATGSSATNVDTGAAGEGSEEATDFEWRSERGEA
jgi:sec-independent protein translocase protein TatA